MISISCLKPVRALHYPFYSPLQCNIRNVFRGKHHCTIHNGGRRIRGFRIVRCNQPTSVTSRVVGLDLLLLIWLFVDMKGHTASLSSCQRGLHVGDEQTLCVNVVRMLGHWILQLSNVKNS